MDALYSCTSCSAADHDPADHDQSWECAWQQQTQLHCLIASATHGSKKSHWYWEGTRLIHSVSLYSRQAETADKLRALFLHVGVKVAHRSESVAVKPRATQG